MMQACASTASACRSTVMARARGRACRSPWAVGRRDAAPLDVRHAHVSAAVRQRGRLDGRRRRIREARLRERRRVDPGPQHVRPRARRMARRQLARLVGRQSAVSLRGLRADAQSPQVVRDGRRHDVPLRHRRHRGSAEPRAQSRWRQGRAARRRRRDDSAVSARAPHRRAAHRFLARAVWAQAKRCSPASICRPSATRSRSTSRRRRCDARRIHWTKRRQSGSANTQSVAPRFGGLRNSGTSGAKLRAWKPPSPTTIATYCLPSTA